MIGGLEAAGKVANTTKGAEVGVKVLSRRKNSPDSNPASPQRMALAGLDVQEIVH
jgi:hypothetical protein